MLVLLLFRQFLKLGLYLKSIEVKRILVKDAFNFSDDTIDSLLLDLINVLVDLLDHRGCLLVYVSTSLRHAATLTGRCLSLIGHIDVFAAVDHFLFVTQVISVCLLHFGTTSG